MDDKAPLYLTLLGAVLLGTYLLVAQPYSVRSGQPSPWDVYTKPAQRFLEAAVEGDSLELARRSVSPEAVAWGLAAARRYPDSLAVWARESYAWTGVRRGDTVEVLFSTGTKVCEERPVWLRFVGESGRFKVLAAGSGCFGPEKQPDGGIRTDWLQAGLGTRGGT